MATIIVSGFGDSASNGVFTDDGTYLGQPRWVNASSSRWIRSSGGGSPRWYIATTQTGEGTGAIYYDNNTISSDPYPYSPGVSWIDAGGGGTLGSIIGLLNQIVAFWKLDESSGDAADSVGAYTLSNRGTSTYESGLINNCVTFGTANSTKALNTSNDLGISGGPISISLWVKLNAEIASGVWSLAVQQDFGSKVGYWFRYYYNSGTPYLEWERWRNNTSDQNGTYAVGLGTSSWHHLVITYDGSTVKGYLDGTERASFSASGNGSGSPGGSEGFAIGSDDGVAVGSAGNFKADACGVWNRALSVNEVAALYDSGNGKQYPFSDASFSAAIVAVAATIPTVSVATGVAASPSALASTFGAQAPTVTLGVAVGSGVLASTFSLPPSEAVSSDVAIAVAAPTSASFSTPASSSATGAGAAVAAVAATFSLAAAGVATSALIAASVLTAALAIPALRFVGGRWRDQARTTVTWTDQARPNP